MLIKVLKYMYMYQITTFYHLHQNTKSRKITTLPQKATEDGPHDRIYPYLYPSDVPLKPKKENLDN